MQTYVCTAESNSMARERAAHVFCLFANICDAMNNGQRKLFRQHAYGFAGTDSRKRCYSVWLHLDVYALVGVCVCDETATEESINANKADDGVAVRRRGSWKQRESATIEINDRNVHAQF